MKRSFKVAVLCFFAVLLAGCLPQQKLTGRVMDTAGPVPGAAVLAMVWIEDAGKALPAPDIRNLAQMDLDIILQKDMKNRGLPAAYARAFTDENGRFDLDTLHFSAETKTAVKVMAQPKISRITLNAFQRGYLKHAATVFPKDISKELSPAVVRLSKPESWKQLALDNPYRTLRRDEYDQGYSKEFGATKAEKKWFLDYISSNLNEAYQASNIKGDKQWEEDCGRDFSDIVISSSGMQRNPNHEKCNELLREMGVLRDWEKLWVDHSYVPDARQTPAINAIKEAVNALEAEFAEIKQYEAQIIAGAEEAAKKYDTTQVEQNLHNSLNDSVSSPLEAQGLYNGGDKMGAYKALGNMLYNQLPVEFKREIVTAMLPATAIPGIRETAVGFYLLLHRPLTAQLPGNNGGNHKDKPKAEIDKSTETKNEGIAIANASLHFYDKDLGKVRELSLAGKTTSTKIKTRENKEIEGKITHLTIPLISENQKYAVVNTRSIKTILDKSQQIYADYGQVETNTIALYGANGIRLFEEQFPEGVYVTNPENQITVSDTGNVALVIESSVDAEDGYWAKLNVYDKAGSLILTYPDEKASIRYVYTSGLEFSPNGRYLSARVGFPDPEYILTVFFDLKTKMWWKAERSYVVYGISNKGWASVSYPNQNIPNRVADKQIKEKRIIEETLDLTKYLGK